MTYREAVEKLKGKTQRKIGNNTWLIDRGGSIAVKLHQTDVVTFYPCGSVKLDSGGWRTVTTKARINEYAEEVRVYQKKHQWYVATKLIGLPGYDWDNPIEYYDGIITKQ